MRRGAKLWCVLTPRLTRYEAHLGGESELGTPMTLFCLQVRYRRGALFGTSSMPRHPATGRRAKLLQLSKSGDHRPVVARRRQGWGLISTFVHDEGWHGIIIGSDLGAPAPRYPLWTFQRKDKPLAVAGKVKG
jgi:hypothetical protein